MALFAYVFVLAAFLVADSFQSTTEFLPCKVGSPPLDLRVNGCTKFPCPFPRGKNVSAQWDFNVVAYTETLKPRVRATALGVTVNFPMPEQDACKSLTNAECPLDEGEEVTYALVMPVQKFYPKVPLTVEFALIDENGHPQVCFSVKAEVV